MSEEKDYEIFYNDEGVKKVRTAGGNTYPEGSPEYAKIVGEATSEQNQGLEIAMRPILNFNILRVEFPQEIIDLAKEDVASQINFVKNRSGLGLFFAKLIAKAHINSGKVGKITLENGGCLGGSCFSLYLP